MSCHCKIVLFDVKKKFSYIQKRFKLNISACPES